MPAYGDLAICVGAVPNISPNIKRGARDPGLNDMQKKIILRLFLTDIAIRVTILGVIVIFGISFSRKNKFKNDNNVIFVGVQGGLCFPGRPAGLSCTKAPLSLTVKSCGHYTGAFHGRSGHPILCFITQTLSVYVASLPLLCILLYCIKVHI